MNDRLAKDIETMRQRLESTTTPPKTKEEKKSVTLAEKQKAERAAKRGIQCIYCKRRGHQEAECCKKETDANKPPRMASQPEQRSPPESQETQQTCAKITVPAVPPHPFQHSIPEQQYWNTQRYQPHTDPIPTSHPLYDFANFNQSHQTTNDSL